MLAARCEKSNTIPSELELVLSSHRNEWCQKVRVVPSLCAGAHFIFPGGTSSKPTIALRVYEEKDILALEQHEMPTFHDTVVYLNQLNTSSNCGDENNKWHSDLDDLQKFRDSYKNSLVFFVLPVGELQIRQLTQPYSFFQMAQRILSKPSYTPTAASNQEPITPGIAARNQTRMFLVTDALSILKIVSAFVDSITPEKHLMKKQFFQGQAAQASQQSVLAGAFRAWASSGSGASYNIPVADVNVLFSLLGSIENIMMADTRILDSIPIQETSKIALLHLLHGEQQTTNQTVEIDHTTNATSAVLASNEASKHYWSADEQNYPTASTVEFVNSSYKNNNDGISNFLRSRNVTATAPYQLQQNMQPHKTNGVNFTPIVVASQKSAIESGMHQPIHYGNAHEDQYAPRLLNNGSRWQQQNHPNAYNVINNNSNNNREIIVNHRARNATGISFPQPYSIVLQQQQQRSIWDNNSNAQLNPHRNSNDPFRGGWHMSNSHESHNNPASRTQPDILNHCYSNTQHPPYASSVRDRAFNPYR